MYRGEIIDVVIYCMIFDVFTTGGQTVNPEVGRAAELSRMLVAFSGYMRALLSSMNLYTRDLHPQPEILNSNDTQGFADRSICGHGGLRMFVRDPGSLSRASGA